MAKHEISISVKAARAQIAAARRRAGEDPGGKSAGSSSMWNKLAAVLEKNVSALHEVSGQLRTNVRAMADLGRRLASWAMRVTRVGTGSGGAGGPLSGLRSSIPALGFAVSGIALMLNKAVQAGRAAIAATEQQAQTAGLGGFQTSGAGTFRPSEVGRFEYERRIARGGRGRNEFDLVPMDQPLHGERGLALRYARKTGTDVSEAARTVGLFETQGGGFGRSLARMRKEGLDVSQFRVVFQELVPALEEAVAGGVSRSGLASDMARQIATLSRYFPGGVGARAAAATVRSFTGLGEQVSRGQWGTMPGMLLMKAAESMAGRKGGLKSLTREGGGGLYEGMSPDKLRQMMSRDVFTRQAVMEQLARSPETQLEMVRRERERIEKSTPAGITGQMRDVRTARIMQGMGTMPSNMTLNQLVALIKRSREEPGKVTTEDIAGTKTALKPEERTAAALKFGVRREEILLGIASEFIPIVRKLDDAAISLGRAGASLERNFNLLSTISGGIKTGAEQLPRLVTGLSDLVTSARGLFGTIGAAFRNLPTPTWNQTTTIERGTRGR